MEGQGHLLLRHNYYTRFGELDLVTIDSDNVLHAVEVKSWSSAASPMHPLESIGRRKMDKMRRAMLTFISEIRTDKAIQKVLQQRSCHPVGFMPAVSFDLVAVFPKGSGLIDGEEELAGSVKADPKAEPRMERKMERKVEHRIEHYENIF